MRLLIPVLAAVALLFPATASALPGDPPVEAVAPADGATLPVDANGIEVRYACPEPYHSTSEPFAVYGARRDYGVWFSATPALGGDGRLLQSDLVAIAGPDELQDNDLPAGQCRAFMADRDNTPEITPGTYYWQAWRTCLECPGSYETTAVRSFRLTAAGSGLGLTLEAPGSVFRGFPFAVTLGGEGVTGDVALQVKGKGAWRGIGRTAAASAIAAVTLPRGLKPGRYRLRATARVGSETVTSGARRLRLRKAKGWSTSSKQDGAWSGTADKLPVSFRVAGNGRTIRAGRFRITLLCPTPGQINPFTIQIADAPLTRARIAPDGSFVFAGTVRGHATFIHGRIRGDRATGWARLTLGPCTGSADFSASR